MATAVYSNPAVQFSSLDKSSAIALVLARSYKYRSPLWPYVKDISKVFFQLRGMGFRFRDLGLRRIPEGYYSEDVENFVGQLLSMGYAVQRSPIELDADGMHLCEQIIARQAGINRSEIEKVDRAIGELLESRSIS